MSLRGSGNRRRTWSQENTIHEEEAEWNNRHNHNHHRTTTTPDASSSSVLSDNDAFQDSIMDQEALLSPLASPPRRSLSATMTPISAAAASPPPALFHAYHKDAATTTTTTTIPQSPSFYPHHSPNSATTTTTLGPLTIHKSGPLYVTLFLMVTIPMVFLSLVSTSRVHRQHPQGLPPDHPPLVESSRSSSSSSSTQTIRRIGPATTHPMDQNRHYLGRPYNWQHLLRLGGSAATSLSQVQTLHETSASKISLATTTTNKNDYSPQQPQHFLVESLDLIVVILTDESRQRFWLHGVNSPSEEEESRRRRRTLASHHPASDPQQQRDLHYRWLAGTVESIHESPFAAARRIVQTTLSVGGDENNDNGDGVLSLDAYGVPIGKAIPEEQRGRWKFLGQGHANVHGTVVGWAGGPLVLTYLYQVSPPPRQEDIAALWQPQDSTLSSSSYWKSLTRQELRRAWRRGGFVDLIHSQAAALALFGDDDDDEQ